MTGLTKRKELQMRMYKKMEMATDTERQLESEKETQEMQTMRNVAEAP